MIIQVLLSSLAFVLMQPTTGLQNTSDIKQKMFQAWSDYDARQRVVKGSIIGKGGIKGHTPMSFTVFIDYFNDRFIVGFTQDTATGAKPTDDWVYGCNEAYFFELAGSYREKQWKVLSMHPLTKKHLWSKELSKVRRLTYNLQVTSLEGVSLKEIINNPACKVSIATSRSAGVYDIDIECMTPILVDASRGMYLDRVKAVVSDVNQLLPDEVAYQVTTSTAKGTCRCKCEYAREHNGVPVLRFSSFSEDYVITANNTQYSSFVERTCHLDYSTNSRPSSAYTLTAFGLPEPPWLTPATPAPAGVPWTVYGVAVGFALLLLCIWLSRRKAAA